MQLNPAAFGYYEKYLNTSKLEESTELARENKLTSRTCVEYDDEEENTEEEKNNGRT